MDRPAGGGNFIRKAYVKPIYLLWLSGHEIEWNDKTMPSYLFAHFLNVDFLVRWDFIVKVLLSRLLKT